MSALLRKVVQRVARQPLPYLAPGPTRLAVYPALLSFYGAGLSALARDDWTLLKHLMYDTRLFEGSSVIRFLNPAWVFEGTVIADGVPASFNSKVFTALRNPVRDIAPGDAEYERLFYRFECFISLVSADLFHRPDVPPVGRLTRPALDIYNEVISESRHDGECWPPLAAGFFGRDPKKLESARTRVMAILREMSR